MRDKGTQRQLTPDSPAYQQLQSVKKRASKEDKEARVVNWRSSVDASCRHSPPNIPTTCTVGYLTCLPSTSTGTSCRPHVFSWGGGRYLHLGYPIVTSWRLQRATTHRRQPFRVASRYQPAMYLFSCACTSTKSCNLTFPVSLRSPPLLATAACSVTLHRRTRCTIEHRGQSSHRNSGIPPQVSCGQCMLAKVSPCSLDRCQARFRPDCRVLAVAPGTGPGPAGARHAR